jgi:hypothetical protein
MKLYEDVPKKLCQEIVRYSKNSEKKTEIEIPAKWDTIILETRTYRSDISKGISTLRLVLEEAFPGKNPLIEQFCKENIILNGEKQVYVIYSDYIEEIKIVLPVACSLKGSSLSGHTTPKMNLFLHYIDAQKEVMVQFKDAILEEVKEKGLDYFPEMSRFHLDILKKNMMMCENEKNDKQFRNILNEFWKLIFQTTEKIKTIMFFGNIKSHCDFLGDDENVKYLKSILKNGGKLTHLLMKNALRAMRIHDFVIHGYSDSQSLKKEITRKSLKILSSVTEALTNINIEGERILKHSCETYKSPCGVNYPSNMFYLTTDYFVFALQIAVINNTHVKDYLGKLTF